MEVIKTTSSQRIIQQVSTNFRIKDANWHGDALDWIGQAIRGIGYHTGFTTKTTTVKIKNRNGKLPADLESLSYVYYQGLPLPISYDRSDLLDRDVTSGKNVATYEESLELEKEVKRFKELQASNELNPNKEVEFAISQSATKISALVNNTLGLGSLADSYDGDFYKLDGGYIKTTFPEGEVEVTYTGFMLDERNYPLVVDTYKYTKALEWYLMASLLLQGYTHPVIDYRMADAKWEDFRQQASNEAKIFSPEKMERFMQRWLSLKRDIQIVDTI